MAQEESAGSTQSSWSRPKAGPDGDDGAPEAPPKRGARAIAKDVSAALSGGLSKGADHVGAAMRTGIGGLEHALADPAQTMSQELLKEADLPEISTNDPIGSIGVRLDREADLWRGVAMRQLARAAFLDRLAVVSTLVVLAGVILLAAIAGFRALFASTHADAVVVLLAVGAVLPMLGVVIVARAVERVRRSQLEVGREALGRADLAEVRLHRLAALLETRNADPEGYAAALRAFERDVRSA